MISRPNFVKKKNETSYFCDTWISVDSGVVWVRFCVACADDVFLD